MASFVGKPIVDLRHDGGGLFTLTVTYVAQFTHDELLIKQEFAESMALFESDSGEIFGGGDDHYFNVPVRTFKPHFVQERRAFLIGPINGAQLDSEPGGEEVYAQVHFRPSNATVSMIRNSDTFSLAV